MDQTRVTMGQGSRRLIILVSLLTSLCVTLVFNLISFGLPSKAFVPPTTSGTAPTITSISPASQTAFTSFQLTVTGTNFGTAGQTVQVYFTRSGQNQASGQLTGMVSSATSILVNVPDSFFTIPNVGLQPNGQAWPNTVNFIVGVQFTNISMTNPPVVVAGNELAISKYVATLTRINPASVTVAQARAGFAMTVTGTNFSNSTTLTISGQPVTINERTTTTLTIQVPAEPTRTTTGSKVVRIFYPGSTTSTPNTSTTLQITQ